MQHRTLVTLTALFGTAVLLSGCATTPGVTKGGEGEISIGLILEGRNDPWSVAWSDAADALMAEDPSVSFTKTYDAVDPTAAEPVARQLLDGGVDVLFMTSFRLTDVAKQLSTEYAQVPMLVTSFGEPQQKNMWLGTSSYLEIGYATCYSLALASDNGRIGQIVAMQDVVQSELQTGCALGAEAAVPGAEIVTLNTNSYTDEQASREQTEKLLEQGIENIFFTSAGAESNGGLNKCEQAGAVCATWAADTRNWAPTAGAASVTIDWTVVFKQLIAEAKSGPTEAQTFNATFGNGALAMQPLDGTTLESKLSVDMKAKIAAMVAGLTDGSIALPTSIAHPGQR